MRIKRLYIFLLKTFLPLFVMTFGICLFIVLMQFLWKYVDDMVGKGLGMGVLAEMFSYAALTLVPLALPLAVLLASLMTFGNLGEQSELLAMKAAGISLFRVMKPLIIVLCLVAVGAFYFQNSVVPLSQVKMWTLVQSMRQKSPELDIPEGTFSNEIAGYNIYVEKKERDGLLRNLMIYDHSAGFNSAQVIVADSGRLKMATSKLYLILSMSSGEAFENLNSQGQRTKSNEAVPYRKETFATKEFLIKYDANFNRADESMMRNRYVGKNLADLRKSIDSMTLSLDSVKEQNATLLYNHSYKRTLDEYRQSPAANHKPAGMPAEETAEEDLLDFDELYRSKTAGARLSLLTQAKSAFENMKSEYAFKATLLAGEEKEMRRHHTEMHKKFTLSFACLIFFFIGAPLGAIIRKGGLGMPVVISVLLFVFYYIIDNIGFKMASNGMWAPWEGMWLSSAVLLPLGGFLTWKAVNDSVILNADTYVDGFKKWMGIRISRKIEKKEVIMYQLDRASFRHHIAGLKRQCETYLSTNRRWISYLAFWKRGGRDSEAAQIVDALEQLVEEGSNSDRNLVLNKLMDYPVVNAPRKTDTPFSGYAGILAGCLFPVGLPLYLAGIYRRRFLLSDIRSICRVSDELLDILESMENDE
ncbi:MAG: LptF/LptG family permease [Tannerella sp.]|jgi:lipopolysaccharide export system permease protein|nr:LptF/LptG family permease [Tannerella sp.]